jgi:copper homeostasis protein
MTPLLEICVETVSAAIAAERGGAGRIELSASLSVGGLTPSERLMREARAAVKIPIFAMIRPRGDEFVYCQSELAEMRREIEIAKASKLDGVVLGILRGDNTINVDDTRKLVRIACPLPVTFHRAFDFARNLHEALEAVIASGAKRILTSGGKSTAREGVADLAGLVSASAGRIAILPGGGLNASNLREVAALTGASEFHSGLGTTLPYGQSSDADFEAAVHELAELLASTQP